MRLKNTLLYHLKGIIPQQHPKIHQIKTVMNKQKKSYTMSINFEDFKELPFYMEYLESIHNQNFNEDFEKFYSMLCELEFEHVNV